MAGEVVSGVAALHSGWRPSEERIDCGKPVAALRVPEQTAFIPPMLRLTYALLLPQARIQTPQAQLQAQWQASYWPWCFWQCCWWCAALTPTGSW